jgi:hypothetical protein
MRFNTRVRPAYKLRTRHVEEPIPSPWTLQTEGIQGTVKFGFNTCYGIGFTDSGQTANTNRLIDVNGLVFRDSIEWRKLETGSVGNYNWASSFGLAIHTLALHNGDQPGQEMLVTLKTGNTLYGGNAPNLGPFTASGITAHNNYVAEVVSHLSPMGVNHYEYGNEMNLNIEWRGGIANYIQIAKAAYNAGKAENSDMKLWIGGIIQPLSTFTDSVTGLQYDDWIDTFAATDWSDYPDVGFSYHGYETQNFSVAQATPEARYATAVAVKERIDTVDKQWELSWTEGGYFTEHTVQNLTDAQAGVYYSRWFPLFRCVPGMRLVLPWMLQSDVQFEEGYGLWMENNTEKTSITGPVRHVLEKLKTASTGRLWLHDNGTTRLTAHQTDDGYVYFIMDPTGDTAVDVTFVSTGSATLTVRTAGGADATQALSAGNNTISITAGTTAKILTSSLTGLGDFQISGAN